MRDIDRLRAIRYWHHSPIIGAITPESGVVYYRKITVLETMETNLEKIKELSKKKEDENWKFRAFLKWHDMLPRKMDSLVHDLYQRASKAIECRTCANCCIELQPIMDEEDIQRLSKGIGISITEFRERYLAKDEDSKGHRFNMSPCQFLVDNQCSHYAHRPKECRSYPHLHKKDFTSRLINVIENCSVCPIVYNVFEELKVRLSFRR